MLVLPLVFSWAVAALNVFIRDVGQIVGVILHVGFWATPILWDISIMPQGLQTVFKFLDYNLLIVLSFNVIL